jgi:hypothetical protein
VAAAAALAVFAPAATAATTWYVAPGGSDAASCVSPAAACATIDGAIGKAAAGDTIRVAVGTYTGTGSQVVLVDESVTLEGGWNAGFTARSGMSTIDGETVRAGIWVAAQAVRIDRFVSSAGSPARASGRKQARR